MVNIENIKQKYCMDDDLSKAVNAKMHNLKQKGLKIGSKGLWRHE